MANPQPALHIPHVKVLAARHEDQIEQPFTVPVLLRDGRKRHHFIVDCYGSAIYPADLVRQVTRAHWGRNLQNHFHVILDQGDRWRRLSYRDPIDPTKGRLEIRPNIDLHPASGCVIG